MTDDQAPIACPVPTHDDGAPPMQPALMLAFRFLLELVAFWAIGLAGWQLGDGGLPGGVLTAAMAITAMALWGALTVPDDPARNPTPVIVVPGWARLLVELAIFGVAAWSLWVFVSRTASETFLTAAGIVYIVGWDRIWWMLRQR
ncbi:MAG TPA: YrdB family protein [Thermomicrobiales bacterium]|nr:YrdB family protein [Thermomicrobiales bacterium]